MEGPPIAMYKFNSVPLPTHDLLYMSKQDVYSGP